jgi:2-polyprenyl-3-methyl-5-hydroxy-6-metoxy-1,4-benzoquinol methylase
MTERSYQTLLEQESQVWGEAARHVAESTPPDWEFMRRTPAVVFVYNPYLKTLLNRIKPGWRVLEIGCSSGWISLEMARRGAQVEGIDIAPKAIRLAQHYADLHPPPAPGRVRYRGADINTLTLEPSHYDLVVVVGALHHLAEVQRVLEQIRNSLVEQGLLFVIDPLDTPRVNSLIIGALMMLLPTTLSYSEKFRHLRRLGTRSISHMRDSIEAQGLSPFEGFGRHQQPLQLVQATFEVESLHYESAFVGYMVHNLRLPRRALMGVGRILWVFDKILVKCQALKGLNYALFARKRRDSDNRPNSAITA